MTKEEYIEKLIDFRKQGYEQPRNAICDEVSCSDCYFACEPCRADVIINILLDHIIGLEESTVDIIDVLQEKQKETNLEHYYKGFTGYRMVDGRTTVDMMFEHDVMSMYNQDDEWDFAKWLLQPYKPKQRYMMDKLTSDIVKQWAEVNEIYKSDEAYGSDLFDILFDLGLWNDSWGDVNELDMWEFADNAEVIDNG